MSYSAIHAFFVGRAVAQSLAKQLEKTLTQGLSELGKFDAEQREALRQFTQEVMARAEQEVSTLFQDQPVPTSPFATTSASSQAVDLQETIDDLRAEVARLRSELQNYRNRTV